MSRRERAAVARVIAYAESEGFVARRTGGLYRRLIGGVTTIELSHWDDPFVPPEKDEERPSGGIGDLVDDAARRITDDPARDRRPPNVRGPSPPGYA